MCCRTIMRRNLWLLAASQFCAITALFGNTTVTNVIGKEMVGLANIDSIFATFPFGFYIAFTAAIIAPAGMAMNKFGYKYIFIFGTVLSCMGSLLCVGGLLRQNDSKMELALFTMGAALQGCSYGITNYYRHVAALMGGMDEGTKSWFVAIVISAGALAGIVGPGIVSISSVIFPYNAYVATYVLLTVVHLVHMGLVGFVEISTEKKKPLEEKNSTPSVDKPRPFLTIIKNIDYLHALVAGTVGHSLMILLMGAATLVLSNKVSLDYISIAIQVHAVCMFFPSFFTSKLIAKFGSSAMALVGNILGAIGAGIYIVNDGNSSNYYAAIVVSLAVIGLGWNFVFISATTLLSGTYKSNEKFKAQAFNDTWLFGVGGLLSLLSGILFKFDPTHILISCVVIYVIVCGITLVYTLKKKCLLLSAKVFPTSDTGRVQRLNENLQLSADVLVQQTVIESHPAIVVETIPVSVDTGDENYQIVFESQRADVESETDIDQNSPFTVMHLKCFHSRQAMVNFLELLDSKLSANCCALLTMPEGKLISMTNSEKQSDFEKILESIDFASISDSSELHVIKVENYDVIMMRMSEFRLAFISTRHRMSETPTNQLNWLDENKNYIESLLKTLQNVEVVSTETIVQSDNKKMVIEGVTKLFEDQLLKRRVKENADLSWDNFGIHEFQKHIWYYVSRHEPILFVLPAFPFKSGNTKKKVLGTLPDMGEKLALERLETFLKSISKIYQPGASLVIFSDGRVYCDLFCIPDETVSKFKTAVRLLYPSPVICWFDFDMFFTAFDDEEKRKALVNLFDTSHENISERLKTDRDSNEVYLGFKRFMHEELHFPEDYSNTRKTKECGRVAKRLVMRNYCYQHFMQTFFPNHIRLSIHPSTSTTKFSINLVGETDWGTPWHNCALLQTDGTWSLIRRHTAEKNGFELVDSGDGLLYFKNNSGKLFIGSL